ncbi:hypothetical protein D3C83_317830 [compost metagenome]
MIGGNTTLNRNEILTVDNNRIGGRLSRVGNAVVTGGNNTAKGGKTGQCASL